jgi:pimeloyl-ACP methyl ester carboxylesterase
MASDTGPPDDDLPDHDQATMSRLFARAMPDSTDREAVAEFAAAGAEIRGDDPVAARSVAARIWDRTPGTAPAVQMANQMGMVFSKLNCTPLARTPARNRDPTLVLHGRRDPFFPVGNGEAITREIAGARLLVLEEAATAIPDAAAGRDRRLAASSATADSCVPGLCYSRHRNADSHPPRSQGSVQPCARGAARPTTTRRSRSQ